MESSLIFEEIFYLPHNTALIIIFHTRLFLFNNVILRDKPCFILGTIYDISTMCKAVNLLDISTRYH